MKRTRKKINRKNLGSHQKEFYIRLLNLLKVDKHLMDSNRELLKSVVINKAWEADHDLIKLLLSDSQTKEKFFDKVNDSYVFNTKIFIDYISNKDFLDNSYTRFSNKIGINIDNKFLKERGEVSLVWPYKDCVLEGGQTKEDDKRNEIFFNEILAQDEIDRLFDPKVFTHWKRYTITGEEKVKEIKRDENGIIKENLIIKGNNLLALHSLKKEFADKIKLIYIDPPYNTGGDNNIFTYNNRFNHSSWLTFMKNRLEVAKELLKDNGIIAITIDDFEQAQLKILCDEIFENRNFLGTVIIQNNPRGRTINKNFATCHEYCHFYAKNSDFSKIQDISLTSNQIKKIFTETDNKGQYRLLPFRRSGGYSTPEERPNSYYPIYWNEKKNEFSLTQKNGFIKILPIDKNGKKRVWRLTKPSFIEEVNKKSIVCKYKKNREIYSIHMKDRAKEGRKPKTIWNDSKYDASTHGTIHLKEMFEGEKLFSYPKSIYAVRDTIKIISDNPNDIILDFFSGSGTTGEAVITLNNEDGGARRFILIEQLEDHISVCKERIKKTKKEESFIYCELMKFNEAYMDKIQRAKSLKEMDNLYDEVLKNSFLNWYINKTKSKDTINSFKNIGKEENGLKKQKELLVKFLNKNQLYTNLSEIEDSSFKVSKEDKELNKLFYKKTG